MVLAFLTNSRFPWCRPALRQRWSQLAERLRECVLATVIERVVAGRSEAIRDYFDPADLTSAVAVTAVRILSGGKGRARAPSQAPAG